MYNKNEWLLERLVLLCMWQKAVNKKKENDVSSTL